MVILLTTDISTNTHSLYEISIESAKMGDCGTTKDNTDGIDIFKNEEKVENNTKNRRTNRKNENEKKEDKNWTKLA